MEFNIIDIGIGPAKEKKSILVVDDELSLQSLIFDTLSEDYIIHSALNGREAITKAEKVQPALILMDLMMPDIGGYEAVQLLNGNQLTRSIPVLIITARNFDQTTISLLKNESNVIGFIAKPFHAKELRELVKTSIEKNPS
jgi:CheY-like chemotaxis protein